MKGPDAFRTISEVAEELDLPQHVLRFWETRFNQIKPMKRGGGRRYYRPEDVDLLRGIRLLLYAEGFTIRGVQRLLKEKGTGFVTSVGQSGSVETMTGADAADLDPRPASGAEKPAGKASARSPGASAVTSASGPAMTDGAGEPGPKRTETPVRRPSAGRDPDRRRIEAALGELQEARRLLDSAFREA
jgi:DNA-binding transcriptional MerR regulator